MKPLTAREARFLDHLERGLGWRLLAGPLVGALGGLVFAYALLASTPGGRFTLGDTSLAYAGLEAAVGPLAAFYLLCVAAFGGLGVFLMAVVLVRFARMRRHLRARRDAAGVAA